MFAGTGLRRNNSSMSSRLLPLFPLQVVVFPRTHLPLHIFEDRYKEMVGLAVQENSEFGIVLAKDDGIVNAGCTVIVEKVLKNYPDGKMDILTCGRRRFEVMMLNEERDYLRGEVQFFDDDESGPAPLEVQHMALTQYKSLLESGVLRQVTPEPDLEDPQLSFQLAQALQDVDFLNTLLRNRSETQRLRELTEFLAQYIPRQRHITRVRQVAPGNGFGGKPAGL
jgi:Lon protease-like protein